MQIYDRHAEDNFFTIFGVVWHNYAVLCFGLRIRNCGIGFCYCTIQLPCCCERKKLTM